MDDLRAALDDHVAAFNAAVTSQSFERFVSRFASNAQMRFTNVPIGPFDGQLAILAAYQQQPPDDTMTITSADEVDGGMRAGFRWSAGGTGTMFLRWAGDEVSELEITLDATE